MGNHVIEKHMYRVSLCSTDMKASKARKQRWDHHWPTDSSTSQLLSLFLRPRKWWVDEFKCEGKEKLAKSKPFSCSTQLGHWSCASMFNEIQKLTKTLVAY